MLSKFGYGYVIDGVYRYGYKTKERCFCYMRKQPAFKSCRAWEFFFIDSLGYHAIQTWEDINVKH